ncbi:sodium-dependent transporter [Thermococcus sp. SY098]|uniref:sodium-dependent transporter n=1 Tax=Thermococcus sp. SY098 TaxID=3111325 RepID=UPI002D789ABA|nr:sodium-dependent transporter [Thermococcus sp. SY098]WRS52320.1 sodium-dependent transporter [Thermococcus sp. SY098]
MRKLTILIILLIVGYMVGIWTFLLFPQILIAGGMKALMLYIAISAVFAAVPYYSLETTKRSRYFFFEYLTKVSKAPSIGISLLMFIIIGASLILYYSSLSITSIVGKGNTLYVALAVVLSLLLSSLILFRAKEKSVVLMGWFAILFLIFTLISWYIIRNFALSVAEKAVPVQFALETLTGNIKSTHLSITFPLVIKIILLAFLGLGLGFGFYIVFGTFLPEETDSRALIGAGYILQLLIGVLATYIVVYSLAVSFPGTAMLYGHATINEATGYIVKIAAALTEIKSMQAKTVLYLLMISVYLAGMTTFIPLIETAGHIISESMQSSRNKAISVALIGVFAVSLILTSRYLRTLFLALFFSFLGIMVAVETLPLILSGNILSKQAKIYSSVVGVCGLLVGISIIVRTLSLGAWEKLGIVAGIVLLVPLLLNSVLIKTRP